MKLKVYCVYDSKVEAYLQPFFMRTKGEAVRGWQEVVNDPNTQFNKHASDFTLFEIGEYDDQTGSIETYQAKISLGSALEFKRASEMQQHQNAQILELDKNTDKGDVQ